MVSRFGNLKSDFNKIMKEAISDLKTESSQQSQELLRQSSDMVSFIESELDAAQYLDFHEFETHVSQLLYQPKLETVRKFQKFKNDQIQSTVRKNLLKMCVEDIMNDYQRLTPSESDKFDRKYGEIVNKANRAVYTTWADGTCAEDELLVSAEGMADETKPGAKSDQESGNPKINFRDIDVD